MSSWSTFRICVVQMMSKKHYWSVLRWAEPGFWLRISTEDHSWSTVWVSTQQSLNEIRVLRNELPVGQPATTRADLFLVLCSWLPVYRGFWAVLLLLGVVAALTASFLIICAAPFASHFLYKAGGGSYIAAGRYSTQGMISTHVPCIFCLWF